MSKKQQGNQAFKEQDYHKAITLYREYTSTENPDNKAAFNNMALCYHRLKQYHLAIQSCDEAIALDDEYNKAYYRRVMARRELIKSLTSKGEAEYLIFQDCLKFISLCDPAKDSKEAADLKAMSQQYKKQFSSHEPSVESFVSNILQVEHENVEMLSLSWMEHRSEILERQLNSSGGEQCFGKDYLRRCINSSYQQVNDTSSEEKVDLLMKEIKGRNAEKSQIREEKQESNVVEGESQLLAPETEQTKETHNAAADQIKPEQAKQDDTVKTKDEQVQINNLGKKEEEPIAQSVKEDQKTTQIPQLSQIPEPAQDKQPQIQEEVTKQETPQQQEKKQQKYILKQQQTAIQQESFQQKQAQVEPQLKELQKSPQEMYQQYFNLQKSKNLFDDFVSRAIIVIKDKSLSKGQKQAVLKYAATKFKQFKWAIKSMGASTRAEITQLILEAGLSEEIMNYYTRK